MTDTLNPEQRRWVTDNLQKDGIIHRVAADNWYPDIYPGQWKALVTWLSNATESAPTNFDRRVGRHRLTRAINTGEVETLERMALEILEAQDD